MSDDAKASHARRRAKRAPEDRFLIRFLQTFDVLFARVYHRLEVHSPVRVPRSGRAILVCNHTSALDPVLIQSVNPRVVRWMMAKEFYDGKALNWVFRAVEAIPVARSGRDMAAMRQALRVLERDEVLGVFPEGRIEKSRELLPFQTGVALLAIKTGAPVYPVYLDGTQRESNSMLVACLKPNRAVIGFGPAVEFDRSESDKDALQRATDKIRQAVEQLRDEVMARQGVAVRIARPELRKRDS